MLIGLTFGRWPLRMLGSPGGTYTPARERPVCIPGVKPPEGAIFGVAPCFTLRMLCATFATLPSGPGSTFEPIPSAAFATPPIAFPMKLKKPI